jgi:hypothetical protein
MKISSANSLPRCSIPLHRPGTNLQIVCVAVSKLVKHGAVGTISGMLNWEITPTGAGSLLAGPAAAV